MTRSQAAAVGRRRKTWGRRIAAAVVLGAALLSAAPTLDRTPRELGPRHAGWVRHGKPVPILIYHVIAKAVIAKAPAETRYPELFTPPAEFAAEMRYLARHGFHVVTLQEVYDFWHRGRSLPRQPIVVSFDDGFRNWYSAAYPILRRYRWAGTMNIALNHLGSGDVSRAWVEKLIAAGWELDSHSLTHADVSRLDKRGLAREVAGSRARLRTLFHVPVNFFCYPSGAYDDEAIRAVRSAGYLGATTTRYGLARPGDRFVLARIELLRHDRVLGLGAQLDRLGISGRAVKVSVHPPTPSLTGRTARQTSGPL